MSISTRTLIALAVIAAVFGATDARSQTSDGIYYKSERWVVRGISGQYCELSLTDSPGFSLTFAVEGSGLLKLLRVRNPRFDRQGRDPRAVTWKFDNEALRGRVFSNGEYEPFASYPEMIENFKKAHHLKVIHEGELVAGVSLRGSSRAYSKLEKCAMQWPNGSIPVMPDMDPKPKAASQSFSAPSSTDQEPVPINPAAWVTTVDMPMIHHMRPTTVEFALSADPDGKVASCSITKSSEYPVLDKATCMRLTQRARFHPATNSKGQRVAGEYTGAIRWILPE